MNKKSSTFGQNSFNTLAAKISSQIKLKDPDTWNSINMAVIYYICEVVIIKEICFTFKGDNKPLKSRTYSLFDKNYSL